MNTKAFVRAAVAVSVLGLVALGGCTKKKAEAGQSCTQKEDCADGLDCYVIGVNITCLDKERATPLCKASNICKTQNRCTPSVEHGMGGCN